MTMQEDYKQRSNSNLCSHTARIVSLVASVDPAAPGRCGANEECKAAYPAATNGVTREGTTLTSVQPVRRIADLGRGVGSVEGLLSVLVGRAAGSGREKAPPGGRKGAAARWWGPWATMVIDIGVETVRMGKMHAQSSRAGPCTESTDRRGYDSGRRKYRLMGMAEKQRADQSEYDNRQIPDTVSLTSMSHQNYTPKLPIFREM
ncbi:hypothetical protein KM043_010282 [Ampulex compressa]|nr:hypothetical protein KM043_010282 [Ampulex compressa]